MLWLMRSNEDLDSLDILSYFIKASKRKKMLFLKLFALQNPWNISISLGPKTFKH